MIKPILLGNGNKYCHVRYLCVIAPSKVLWRRQRNAQINKLASIND